MSYRATKHGQVLDRKLIADLLEVPVTNRERLTVVCQALQKAIETELTPRQREVLLLRWYENRSGREIAAILGVNPSTVCRDLKRAQKRLRHALRFYMEYLNCRLEE